MDKSKNVETGLRPVSTVAAGMGMVDPNPNKKQHGISEFIRALKSFSSRRINAIENTKLNIWQRNYYEHVIRNEDDLNQTREYILNNPINWEDDENNIKL